MKKIIAISFLSVLANFTQASLVSQHGEEFATMINMTGKLCAKAVRITSLQQTDVFEVECVEYRGGKGKVQYIVNLMNGTVYRR